MSVSSVKAQSLRELLRDRPDNEAGRHHEMEVNAAIRAVNASLGVVPAATYTTCLLTL